MSGHNLRYQLEHEVDFVVTDPGSGGTIRVTEYSAFVPLKTAGAEARTLAAPVKAGQRVVIFGDTLVGAATLTVTGGFNVGGTTVITLSAAGQVVDLESVKVGANYRWRLTGQQGGSAGTPDRSLVVAQGNPTELADGAATVTIAHILTGIVQMTPTTGRALTLTTGALADAGVSMAIGEAFDWTVLNAAAATHALTVTAAATGHTVVGGMAVGAANSGRFRTRKTADETFVTYRIG